MAKADNSQLLTFLAGFRPEVQETVLWLRDFIWDLYPQANELIYDNYNALAIGWSPTDRTSHGFCSLAVMRPGEGIHFGFYWGAQLTDPEDRLLGQGKQYRFLRVDRPENFPANYVEQLARQAWHNSLTKVKDPRQLKEGLTVVKSQSPHKREKGMRRES
ncbi:MAG: hypothetical protein H6581_16870 [Bacteroidia bacterium]|nr:hypothetical protein [Bacteroidia bacterium]